MSINDYQTINICLSTALNSSGIKKITLNVSRLLEYNIKKHHNKAFVWPQKHQNVIVTAKNNTAHDNNVLLWHYLRCLLFQENTPPLQP